MLQTFYFRQTWDKAPWNTHALGRVASVTLQCQDRIMFSWLPEISYRSKHTRLHSIVCHLLAQKRCNYGAPFYHLATRLDAIVQFPSKRLN